MTTTGSLAGTLGLIQPFRYRGYVYDYETGFYYLQSRYYDPTTGRFISSDVLLSTGQGVLGHNAYAYCMDNPANREDPDGMASLLSKLKDFFTQVVFGAGGSWGGGHIWGSRYKSDQKDEVQNEQNQIKTDPKPPKTSGQYTTGSAHGNSLDCSKHTQGYALADENTGEILKYGETTRGILRYTKSYYAANNAKIVFMSEGTKREMHYWQHEMILSYTAKYGKRPPLNKSDW